MHGAICFSITFALGTVFTSTLGKQLKPVAPLQKKTIKLPTIVSTVSSIPVKGVVFDFSGSPSIVKLRLINNSGKAVIAYALDSGNEKDVLGSGVVNRTVPIAGTNEEFVVDIHLDSVITGEPVRFCAVVFEDGSAEGEEEAAKHLKESAGGNVGKISRQLLQQ